MFCKICGAEINDLAEICPKCGVRVAGQPELNNKKRTTCNTCGKITDVKIINAKRTCSLCGAEIKLTIKESLLGVIGIGLLILALLWAIDTFLFMIGATPLFP